MLRYITVLSILLTVMTPVTALQAQEEGDATLHVYRVGGFGGSAADYRFIVNGDDYGVIDSHSYKKISISAGEKDVWMDIKSHLTVRKHLGLNVEKGKEYYIRLKNEYDQLNKIDELMTLVDSSTGINDIKSLTATD